MNLYIDTEEIKLLNSDFTQLNNNDKNKYLNIKLKLMRKDLLVEQELYFLFEELDLVERYNDMLNLLIHYPKYIGNHYEITSDFFNYNIGSKWDWNLDNIENLSIDELKCDLITVLQLKGSRKMKIQKLVYDKLFKNQDVEEEEKRIHKKLYG